PRTRSPRRGGRWREARRAPRCARARLHGGAPPRRLLPLRMRRADPAYRESAQRAGLRYVTDGVRGIRRKRAGTGWAYYAPDGERIEDAATRKRLNRLAIPPAWTDVWICPDP